MSVCDKKDALFAINKSLSAVNGDSSSINQRGPVGIFVEFNWCTAILRNVRR